MKLFNTLLAFSGGAFKIPFLYGVAVWIKNNLDKSVDAVCGTSSGSIVSALYAMNLLDKASELIISFGVKDVFYDNPNSIFSWIKSLTRAIIKGNDGIFDQSKLRVTLKSVISEEDFYNYKNSKDTIPCYVGVTTKVDKKEHFINLKDLDYEEAIDFIFASCSIPIYTPSVPSYLGRLVDGGVSSHTPAYHVAKFIKPKKLISVFAIPKVFKSNLRESANIFKTIADLIEWFGVNTSMDDQDQIRTHSKYANIESHFIYPDEKLTDKTYKASFEEKLRWCDQGYFKAKEKLG